MRVERFLNALPVRKQAAEKSSAKVLAKIKRLLQAHSLARPHLKLSLKVLKAKNDKGDWKYPKTARIGNSKLKTSTFDAATEIIGKKVTDQCQWSSSTWSIGEEHVYDASEICVTYTFEAVIAKPECGG